MRFWPAKVIDNNDPEKKGRVKIYIEWLMEGIPASDYPWAYQDREFTSYIPEINDMVWVYFENEENFKNPFYKNKISYEDYNEHNQKIGSLEGDYPDIKYIKLKNGVAIAINSNKEEISITNGGAEIFINSTGEIHIKGDGSSIEFTVLGETLKNWLSTHTHPTGVGPSGPPVEVANLTTCLSQKVKIG